MKEAEKRREMFQHEGELVGAFAWSEGSVAPRLGFGHCLLHDLTIEGLSNGDHPCSRPFATIIVSHGVHTVMTVITVANVGATASSIEHPDV